MFSREFCEISKNAFSYRTPPVAAAAFLNTLIWFELKCIAKYHCQDPNVIFLSNWLVVYSLPPAMSSAQTYYEAFNIRHFPYCPPLKKSFHRGTNSFGKLIVGGGELFYMVGLMIRPYQGDSPTNAFPVMRTL